MCLKLLLLVHLIWIQNQIFIFAVHTVTTTTVATEVIDLQDGHPNHRLWQKMIDTGRSTNGNCANLLHNDASINTVEEFLDTLINSSHYDRRIRPFFDQRKPCNVTMTIHINTISAINEVNMDYNTDLIFRQSWYDPRLNYSGTDWAKKSPQITLHYSLIDRIWVPDSFFRNAKEGKRSDITVPNRLIRIHLDGKVLYSQRLLLKLDCQMKLQKFPLDNQTCVVNIGSYGFGTTDLAFFWDETQNISAIRVNEDLEMPDFVLSNHEARYCNRTTATGTYTCLEVHLAFQRNVNLYIQQLYLPATLIVALSFVAFWVDYKSHPARTLLSLLCIVTLTTKAEGIRSQLPRVSYIKAIDVWMSACLVFVFAGLLEYALVNVIARKGELRQQVRFSKEVIGNRLAQVHFYKKDDAQDGGEMMETLVHKSSGGDRNTSGNTSSHVQYSSMSNANVTSSTPAIAPPPPPPPPPPPVIAVPQPARIAQPAKPIRDSAQFKMNDEKPSKKNNKQRRVRFDLQTRSRQPIRIQWTMEEFNDLFKRFRCSVTGSYWQSLKNRVYEKNNHHIAVGNLIWK
ncbi:unnamed protein product [Rotaria socialis]|uniref:Gamma-aminobutyric acid receptor subunit beta n=1 Tax=Rotaria socialis TaxID=392032 RepID=A0A821DB64_9BILA|nr:unnamed protein product [Rotaria socialis]